ncbi:hypothetical protein [Methylocystis parvus]|uniref:hypothetical protein n=1 Tax=Methylocystis parvus TaxID=134 RepID=UPI003C717A53
MPAGFATLTILDYQANQKQMRELDESGAGVGPFLPCVSPQPGGDALGGFWSFAAPPGGLTGVTPAQIITAPGSTLRRYIQSIQISADPLSAATEFVLRETGGATLWRIKIQTGGFGLQSPPLMIPIKPALNAALEIAILSSVTGAVFCNAQGFTAP